MSSLEQYKYMFHSLACGICRVALDENFTLLYANPFYYELYGYTPESAARHGFCNVRYILPDPVFADIRAQVMEHVENKESLFDLEYLGTHKSGKPLWLLVRCTYDTSNPDSILCVLMDIAEHKLLEEELRMSMKESQIAYQLTDKLMYVFDIPEKRLTLPAQVADEFGLPQVIYNVPDSIASSGVIDEGSVDEFVRFYTAMLHGIPEGDSTAKKRKKDGTYGWYYAKYALIYDDAGNPKRSIISAEDISIQREKELAYQKWSQYFKSQEGETIGYYEYDLTADSHMDGAGDNPPDYLQSLNSYTETVLYIAERFVHEDEHDRFCWFFDRNRLLGQFYDNQKEAYIEYKRIDGQRVYWVRSSIQMVTDPHTDHVKIFLMTLDIDKTKQRELKLRKLVDIDEMTGVLKREAFIRKVNDILSTNGFAQRHVFILLDIDKFKQHNDQYGHQFGDVVIRDTAELLKSSLRKHDLCGRLGGDEFMVFLNSISSKEDIMPRISNLCHTLNQEYEGKTRVSCSMGIAFYPSDGTNFQTLYKNADTALYEAKNSGRSIFKTYSQNSNHK